MPTEVTVALISAVAIVAAAVLPAVLIQSLRKENSEDHQYVRRVLTRVERKLDNHLEDHDNGVTRRNKTKH
jgi:type II secretory pathway component PulJ